MQHLKAWPMAGHSVRKSTIMLLTTNTSGAGLVSWAKISVSHLLYSSPRRGGDLTQEVQGHQEWVQWADPNCFPG